MVTQITLLGCNGLSAWLIQRVSAIVLAAYVIFLFAFFVTHPGIPFEEWRVLFTATWMRLFTLLSLLSLMAHSWIGIWTVLTDYVKCSYARLTIQVAVILLLTLCLAWGIQIVWSI